ncbi:geranylgeranylglycerol-phosphate geranylgeranyltransferase [Capnocytophaga sp. ARDL2]|uniref:geranylgeranylglycerol-phosphate geranylgeranyltransferase n=1 Tax=Capnocytophaga sp. ARDL2 TaxID=3238809 RepID=UPI003557AAFF
MEATTELLDVLLDTPLFFIVMSSSFAIAGGYIINNFYDNEKDLINRPLKSIIDQNISKNTQLKTYFSLNFLSILFAYFVSWRAVLFYSVYIFLLWFYSHKLKKYPIIGNISASTLALLPFFGILIHFQNFGAEVFTHALYLYLIVLIRELVKDLENLSGDLANNYQTISVRFGEKTSKYIISILVILTFIPAFILSNYIDTGKMYYYFFTSSGCLIAFLLSLFQAKRKSDYIKLHILLKIILISGILSVILIDCRVLLHGWKMIEK